MYEKIIGRDIRERKDGKLLYIERHENNSVRVWVIDPEDKRSGELINEESMEAPGVEFSQGYGKSCELLYEWKEDQ